MKIKNVIILILSVVFFISCSSDEDESSCIDFERTANVTAVDAPDVATVNEPVDVAVTFSVDNSCGEFADFETSTSGITTTIDVLAVYEGCNCAQVITSRNATYNFTPEQAGDYVLRFRSGTDEFIEETITVEESDSTEE